MLKNVMLGRYVIGDSLIHRLDPRTKLISSVLIITAVLINYQWYYLFCYSLLILIAILMSGIPLQVIFRSLRKIRFLLLLTFIFQAILTKGDPLFSIGKLSVTREGIDLGLGTIVRLLIFYLSSTLLIMTTSTIKLAAGIESLLSPLTYLKVPVHHFSMILSTSLRFIPTFIEEATIITNAQKSRGAPFNSRNVITRLKSNIAVMIPLLAASLQRAEDLALAMESRCYTGHANQTRISKLNYYTIDVLLICVMLTLLLVGIYFAFLSKYFY